MFTLILLGEYVSAVLFIPAVNTLSMFAGHDKGEGHHMFVITDKWMKVENSPV